MSERTRATTDAATNVSTNFLPPSVSVATYDVICDATVRATNYANLASTDGATFHATGYATLALTDAAILGTTRSAINVEINETFDAVSIEKEREVI